MQQDNVLFVGIDTSKEKNAVAVAEAGRGGEVRYLGEFDTNEAATRKWIAKLAASGKQLVCCYEAGPTGYGLQRFIFGLGHACDVIAPSLIPKRRGDQVKTNRRDAQTLARLHRAGELTPIWVPDDDHEAMRELSRARETARVDRTRKRQQIASFLLRHGLFYPPRRKTWGRAHRNWLAGLKIVHRAERIVFEEMLIAERQADERVARIEQAIRETLPDWGLRDLVGALMTMRGLDMISAVTLVAEIGDFSRFASARELMGYLGLVPKEQSTGDSVKRGSITKAGNARARHILSEAAWSYRHPPRVSREKQAKVAAAPEAVRRIAWKAQRRLSARYRALVRGGKKPTVAATAVAREMAGFVWAIGQAMRDVRAMRPGQKTVAASVAVVTREG